MRTPVSLAIVSLIFPAVLAAQATPPASSTLAGVVRDSSGTPLVAVEVVLPDASRGARTDSIGRFTLGNVAPGSYQVWFRRLGYASVQYNWAARPGQRMEIAVTLRPLPRSLDPVIVRAEEDKRMRGRSSISGMVVDSLGLPVDEAEVQIVGAGRTGMTRENGGFVFKGMGVGSYVVRVRKLGFAPNDVKIQLLDGDDRQLVVTIRELDGQLSPVVVNERSGYGKSQVAWDELEQRQRWHSGRAVLLGPEDLKRYHGMALDQALQYSDVTGAEQAAAMFSGGRVTSIYPSAVQGPPAARTSDAATDVCMLVNGRDYRYGPLRQFSASDIDFIEVYPARTEPTGTVAAHMAGPCIPTDLDDHPTYYVIWLKSAS